MSNSAPPPLPITWQPKPLTSARSGAQVLPDGGLHCWIEHEVLQGITPRMLAWWFQNREGDMDFEGGRLPRYPVWHPRDHVRVSYAQPLGDGSIGVGAQLHIVELLNRNPSYRVDVLSDIVRLDEQGSGHRPRLHGLRMAAMDYRSRPCQTAYASSTA
ncbi:DAPG hydrolase family protein [Acidovorax sp.]|uniref:DAPG hydrolase family protein n=1 Tax=Acidovorax sp. TaxID=1872122 RepID=UPI002ACDF5A9|nr:hypothetical protein [Acidovorax sp.]MDZ7865960.1 hypothetical protein [Acidovorax sp.]